MLMPRSLQAVFLSAIFSLWVGACVMLTLVPIENVARVLKLRWTVALLQDTHGFMVFAGVSVFLVAFVGSLIDAFVRKKAINKLNDSDSTLFSVTLRAFGISLLLGIVLLCAIVLGWLLSFVFSEPLSLAIGGILVLSWFAITLVRKPRHA
jgi:hypothetical protein